MKKIISLLKENWILALVVVYIISPIDILPFNPADDISVFVLELARRYIMNRLDKKKISDAS